VNPIDGPIKYRP